MSLIIAQLALTLVACCVQQGGAPAAPPVLPQREVKLVPPPLPPALTAGQAPAPEVSAQLRNGVLVLKIGDVVLPGGCCFCPDGSEQPLRWEPPKQGGEKR